MKNKTLQRFVKLNIACSQSHTPEIGVIMKARAWYMLSAHGMMPSLLKPMVGFCLRYYNCVRLGDLGERRAPQMTSIHELETANGKGSCKKAKVT